MKSAMSAFAAAASFSSSSAGPTASGRSGSAAMAQPRSGQHPIGSSPVIRNTANNGPLRRQSSSSSAASPNYGDTCANDDGVDPRVQVELERLNTATDLINKLEVELDEARASFRQLLNESSHRLKQMAKKLGSCLEKARPYYNARMQAKKLQAETQKAALRFERATSSHMAAKEMVRLAEEGLQKEGRTFDPVWQEMLNHATMRVNEAEQERVISEREHMHTSQAYNEAEQLVSQLHQELKRAIVKSSLSARRNLLQLNNLANQHQLQLLPYFEMKAQFNEMLEEQKSKIHRLEEDVLKVKMSYADALHNLEEISDEIHQRRQLKEMEQVLGTRGPGVGAESPVLSAKADGEHQGLQRSSKQENVFSDETLNSNQLSSSPCGSEESYLQLPAHLNPSVGSPMMQGNDNKLSVVDFLTNEASMSSVSRLARENATVGSFNATTPREVVQSHHPASHQEGHRSSSESNCWQDPISAKVVVRNGAIISKSQNVPLTATPLGDSSDTTAVTDVNSKMSAAVESNESDDEQHMFQKCITHEKYTQLQSAAIHSIDSEEVKGNRDKAGCFQRESSTSSPLSSLECPSAFAGTRTSKEDISDNESMASTDTADTLDDHQIECLMLDKVLEQDFRSMLLSSPGPVASHPSPSSIVQVTGSHETEILKMNP